MKVLIFIVISIGFVLTVDLPQPRDKIQGILETLITKTIKGTQQRILEDPDRLNIYENHGPKELVTGKLDNRSDDSADGSESSEEGMRKNAKLTAGKDNRSDSISADSESSEEGARKNAKLTAGKDNRSDSISADSESSEEGMRENTKITAGKDNRSDSISADSESSEEGMRENTKLTAGKDNRSDSISADSESSEEGMRENTKITTGKDNRSDSISADSESSEEGMRENTKLTAGKDNRSDSISADSESSEEGARKNAKLTAGKDNRSDSISADSESSEEGMRESTKITAGKDNRSDSISADSESSEEGTRKNEVHHRISAKSSQLDIQENDFMPEGLKELIAAKLNDRSDDSISSEEDVKGIERIFGGQIAPRNAYPHQAAMSLMFVTGGSSWCGGSIISDSYILTAAHCLDNVVAATIMMGAYDRLNNAESGRVTQTVRSGNFIVHRGWQSSLMRNDIALIRLNNKIQFTNSIQAISLPTQFDIAEGKPAIISGWGHYDNSKQLSRYLRHAESRIIDLSYCRQYFSQYITENNICLDGSAGKGTCHGDSGGPLIIQSTTGKAVLMGLTSFGSGNGCNMRMPTVFTRVSSFLSWIQQNASI